MIELTRLTAADYEEALDFLDLVFSKAGRPHDFATMYPKMYKPTDESMSCQFALREDGRMRSCIGFFPLSLKTPSRELSCWGVGNVATHPRHQKRGFMKQVMEFGIREMQSENIKLSLLGGQRQRYAYYGYESGGIRYGFTLSTTNLRHCFPDYDGSDMEFCSIRQNDAEALDFAYAVFLRQPFYNGIRTRENLYDHFLCGSCNPYTVSASGGRRIGYIVANSTHSDLLEIVLSEGEDYTAVMKAFTIKLAAGGRCGISMSEWELYKYRGLFDICENMNLSGCESWRIEDWPAFLELMLELKAGYCSLLDGRLTARIADRVYDITVENNVPRVTAGTRTPDVETDGLSAVRLFMSLASRQMACAYPAGVSRLLGSWFPLPAGWKSPDGI